MNIKKVFCSDFRKNIGEMLDETYKTNIPVVVEKKIAGGTKDFIVLKKDLLQDLLDDLVFNVYIKQDENEEYILELRELDLLAYGEDLQECKDNLIEDMYVYAEEYKESIELYYNSPNRKKHFKYLLKLWLDGERKNIEDSVRYIQ